MGISAVIFSKLHPSSYMNSGHRYMRLRGVKFVDHRSMQVSKFTIYNGFSQHSGRRELSLTGQGRIKALIKGGGESYIALAISCEGLMREPV